MPWVRYAGISGALNGRENLKSISHCNIPRFPYIPIQHRIRLTARVESSLSLPFRAPIIGFEDTQDIGHGASALGWILRPVGP